MRHEGGKARMELVSEMIKIKNDTDFTAIEKNGN